MAFRSSWSLAKDQRRTTNDRIMAIYLPGTVEEEQIALDELTPREIVAELDKHVVGQAAAKRAVAIALRNRMRRQKLAPELAEEVIPKNIIMIGPTGVGKTEIARRLAKLANSPFLKVEASKFTGPDRGSKSHRREALSKDAARLPGQLHCRTHTMMIRRRRRRRRRATDRAVDSDLLAEGETNLRDYFQSQGYFDVTVDFKQQQVSNGKTEIEYAIQTGPRHRLVALLIRGNKYFDEKTIRERMSIVPKSFEFRAAAYSEALAARDKAVIEDLYRSNGFRDVHVVAESQDDYKGVKDDIEASFTIDEGHQYVVETLKVTGAKQLDLSKTLDHLSSQEGQPFSEFDVASDRQSILDRYGSAGFADATFEWTWGPGTKPYTVDLQFVISEGSPQFVREVVVTGSSATRRQLVQSQLTEHTDDPLSASSMADTQRKLYDLGIFSQVNMAVQDPDGDEGRRTVLFDLQVSVALFGDCRTRNGVRSHLAVNSGGQSFQPWWFHNAYAAGFEAVSRRSRLGAGSG